MGSWAWMEWLGDGSGRVDVTGRVLDAPSVGLWA